MQPTSSKITVEDCISTQPVSEIGGMRRCTFLTMGQLNLFQRCYSEHGIHDFSAGYCAAGPKPLCNASLMSLSVSAVLSIRGHVDCYSI